MRLTLGRAAHVGVASTAKPEIRGPACGTLGLHMPFEKIESIAKKLVLSVQDYAILTGRAIGNIFQRPRYLADLIVQADSIGIGSVPIVLLTGFFTGGVLALQSASSLAQFGATAITGELVSLSMIKELGPVLTSLMVSGRNASGMASELGSMMVTEQIDAMRALGTDPLKKLVTPRLYATVIMLFFLTILSDTVGTLGGAVISVFMLGQDGSQYFHTAYQTLQYPDIIQGLVKPIVFGFIIASVGCYYGMTTRGGTQGVGRSTTQAVVVSSVLIIAIDLVISQFMIGVFGR
jgi:phospholipid/cholesterol/gamma-HCH transport system permease protein